MADPATPPRPLPRMSAGERFLAWIVTGPVGRGLAFALDLGALAWQVARRRLGGPGS